MTNSGERGVADTSSESGALLQSVLDTAVDAIITIDERGIIHNANRAAERILGYRVEELIGQPINQLMPEPHRTHHAQYIANYLKTGQAKIIGVGRELLARHRDGRLIPVDLAVSEVRVGAQRLFTGILRDMSERNKAEADLRKAEQRLIQTERLAAIGQMVTGLAHESRNALQRSRACLDMLELDLTDAPDQLDWVHRVKTALVELQTLYEEVRNYAAPIKLEKTSQDIVSLIAEIWKHLEDSRTDAEVRLVIHRDDRLAVRCDRQRIGQVIRNIFENSLAVAPKDSRIFVSAELVDYQGVPNVCVHLLDEGPGLSDEQKSKIFEPFFTTKTKGTGLGMAISQRIIEAHGGHLVVDDGRWAPTSRPGADIVFYLPIERN
jgi:two-component system sensor kinase FixL